MKNILKKRSLNSFLKSLFPFSPQTHNPNPNFFNYNPQTPLIRLILPLISHSSSFNGVNHRKLSIHLSESNSKPNNKIILLPGCNFIDCNQHIRLIRSIPPLISNSSSSNGVNRRNLSTRISDSSNKHNNKTILLPGCNFINYNQQIRSIPPLVSSSSSFNGVNHRNFSTRVSESNKERDNKGILLPGCDLMHWLVVVDQPGLNLTRDGIIDGYIKTLATVIGSEEEARMKIYSVSTKHYFAFGALVSEELAYKLKEIPHVRWVLPDSYLDVKNQTYAGEPFINGQAVPYDFKYHAIWLRNRDESLQSNTRNKRKQTDPTSSRPRQSQAGSRYQRQSSEPPISKNGNLYNNSPPLSSPNNTLLGNSKFQGGDRYKNTLHSDWSGKKERLTPSTHLWDSLPSHNGNPGFQRQDVPSHNGYPSFQGQDTPSHNMNPSFRGQDMPSHDANPSFQGQDMPSHYANPSFQGQDMPSHDANLGFQGRVPSHNANPGFHGQNMQYHFVNRGFQGHDMPSENANLGFQGQGMPSHSSNTGFQCQDMPSHSVNPGFRGWDMLSRNANPGFQGFQEQDMAYPHQQGGYSYRGFSGEGQNGNYYHSYVDLQRLQSSNANMTPLPRDIPSQIQKSGIPNTGTSPQHHHQSTYLEFQSSNVTGSHNMNAPHQNSRFSNSNMTSRVQNHYQPIYNSEYQHDMRQASEQAYTSNEGTMPITQSTDYQERDACSDD